MENGFQGKKGQKIPELTPQVVDSISERYIELYEKITGKTFRKAKVEDIEARILTNIETYLNK